MPLFFFVLSSNIYILTSTSYMQFRLLILILSLNCVFVCANCSVYRGVYWKETWIWYSWYHIFLWKDRRTNTTHIERIVGFKCMPLPILCFSRSIFKTQCFRFTYIKFWFLKVWITPQSNPTKLKWSSWFSVTLAIIF